MIFPHHQCLGWFYGPIFLKQFPPVAWFLRPWICSQYSLATRFKIVIVAIRGIRVTLSSLLDFKPGQASCSSGTSLRGWIPHAHSSPTRHILHSNHKYQVSFILPSSLAESEQNEYVETKDLQDNNHRWPKLSEWRVVIKINKQFWKIFAKIHWYNQNGLRIMKSFQLYNSDILTALLIEWRNGEGKIIWVSRYILE